MNGTTPENQDGEFPNGCVNMLTFVFIGLGCGSVPRRGWPEIVGNRGCGGWKFESGRAQILTARNRGLMKGIEVRIAETAGRCRRLCSRTAEVWSRD
jgi:hypothetical protein